MPRVGYLEVYYNTTKSHDMTIGCTLTKELGLILDFPHDFITWADVSVPMKTADAAPPKEFYTPSKTANSMQEFLSTEYAPADLPSIIKHFDHLDSENNLISLH